MNSDEASFLPDLSHVPRSFLADEAPAPCVTKRENIDLRIGPRDELNPNSELDGGGGARCRSDAGSPQTHHAAPSFKGALESRRGASSARHGRPVWHTRRQARPHARMPKRSAPAPSPAPDTGVPTDSVTKKRKSKAPLVIPEPEGWRQRWDLITELRRDRTAVVDQMGSEAIAASSAPGADRAYETLVSLMLSSQTKDTVNMATMKKLRDHGCTVQKILQTPDERLDELIHAVGFHNTKTKHIKQATQMISDNNAGKIPDTMDGLLALPGVGPKMALIILRVVFGKVEGISVDTHVHRIANQLAWTGETSTKTPEHTRAALEAWMPREVWEDVNLVLVGLGQEVQTEKAKLLSKCCGCSRPADALRLAALLGIKVQKELKKAGLDVPSLVVDEDL